MNTYTVKKEFRDFADDIEAVNIHYLCMPTGLEANWEAGRVTRSMPIVEPGIRRLELKLPAQIIDPHGGRPISRYTLFHYFEIFRGGDRHFSQVYDEIVDVRANRSRTSPGAPSPLPGTTRGKNREVQ